MTRKVVFLPAAAAELESGVHWYEAQVAGLGTAFRAIFEAGIESILAFPEACPVVHGNVRRLVLPKFPHCVYFVAEPERVVIVAVYHGRRDPEGWKDRK